MIHKELRFENMTHVTFYNYERRGDRFQYQETLDALWLK